ncbi:MAG: GSCFA domain-containing protein [Chitinophagia bacterium]|nr:GSCFA domain-containing protein [Chitinophagia bacterium]
MQWHLPITIKGPERLIEYGQPILLAGSCFTEHIGQGLADLRFPILQNPHGILFGPDAVCRSIHSYIENKQYQESDLFFWQECWHSWDHHSRFSSTSKEECLRAINASQQAAHEFIKKTDWLILTLGSSFCYRLTEVSQRAGYDLHQSVANCHRAPQQWFSKELLSVQEIVSMLNDCFAAFYALRPQARIIITISPVRHARDGVVENNRSKARLLEALQQLDEMGVSYYYFPAYELVVDVLRDYRFYDIDLVHPNYAATGFVLDQFMEHCVSADAASVAEHIKKLVTAMRHRPRQPHTQSHRQFLTQQYEMAAALQKKYPQIDLSLELAYFKEASCQ